MQSSAAASESTLPLSPKAVEDVIKTATKSIKLMGPDLVEIACGGGGGAELMSHDHNVEQSLVARNWKLLTTSLCLAHSSLQECQLTTRNPLVGTITATCMHRISWCMMHDSSRLSLT